MVDASACLVLSIPFVSGLKMRKENQAGNSSRGLWKSRAAPKMTEHRPDDRPFSFSEESYPLVCKYVLLRVLEL